MSTEQAEAIADAQQEAFGQALDEQFATKADMARLDARIDLAKSELKEEIASVKGELKEEIASVKGELKEEIGKVKGEQVLMKWMLGFNLAFTLAIVWRVFDM